MRRQPSRSIFSRTSRHRFIRAGQRQANDALWAIAMVQMRSDARTREYVARLTGQGLLKKAIHCCLKRYIVLELYPLTLADLTDSVRAARHGSVYACNETLFGSLKLERLHGQSFKPRREAKAEIIDWLLCSNRARRHSMLAYVSPMQFERDWLANQLRQAYLCAGRWGTVSRGRVSSASACNS